MTHTDELADRMQTAALVFARPLLILDSFALACTAILLQEACDELRAMQQAIQAMRSERGRMVR